MLEQQIIKYFFPAVDWLESSLGLQIAPDLKFVTQLTGLDYSVFDFLS
jgi:hypothetical protein